MVASLSDRERLARLIQDYGWQERPAQFLFDEQDRLRHFHLRSAAELSAFPPEIAQFAQLEYLDLSHNHLSRLPADLANLKQLRELYLEHTHLTRLPPEIGQLSQLEVLWLNHNRLTTLPPEIGHLVRLRSLSLGHNRLTALPAEIGQLAQLNDLYLYRNRLTHLPGEIGQLRRLEHLTLGKNPLVELPSEIRQLTNLWTLFLDEKLAEKFAEELDAWFLTPRASNEGGIPRPAPVRSLTERVSVGSGNFSLDPVEGTSEHREQLDGTSLPPWLEAGPRYPASVLNEGGDQIVSVQLEVWEHEPPPPQATWDESCTLSVQVDAAVVVWSGYGDRASRKTLLVGEPGHYHLRCFRHVRPATFRALARAREENSKSGEDDPDLPEHMEYYLFQFWKP